MPRYALRSLPLFLLASLAAIPAPVGAAEKKSLAQLMDGITGAPDYKHATWGILVVNAKTGETVYGQRPDAMLAPASVTKLFSCAAALIALGADHKFETSVHQRGKLEDGILRGDLILVASGDLTLGGRTDKSGKITYRDHDHIYAGSGLMESELTDTDPLAGLNALAKQVKEAGIGEIIGDVLVDDRLFARTRGTGSGPDAVSPIMVNDNVIDILVTPGEKVGDPARIVTRPATSLFQIDALVATVEESAKTRIQTATVGPNQFAIRGRIAKGSKPALRIYPVSEPALFARTLFIEALRRNGVKAECSLVRPNAVLPPRGRSESFLKLATFTSPPLKEALTVTLKVSHNLYASALPCLVAAKNGELTAEQGLREGRKIFKELGVDSNAFSFGGGAGGAAADYITARAAVQLLQGMAKRKDWEMFKSALPVLGVDGTLADIVPVDSPARGKVSAKTGTYIWYDPTNERYLLKSKALAGAMTTKNGTPLFLAMMVNNVPLPKGVAASREGKVLGKLCEILYENGP